MSYTSALLCILLYALKSLRVQYGLLQVSIRVSDLFRRRRGWVSNNGQICQETKFKRESPGESNPNPAPPRSTTQPPNSCRTSLQSALPDSYVPSADCHTALLQSNLTFDSLAAPYWQFQVALSLIYRRWRIDTE